VSGPGPDIWGRHQFYQGAWRLLYGAVGASAPPSYVATGPIVSDVAAITVPWPSGVADGHIGILFVETANQAITLSTPAGFAEIVSSPMGIGTGGTDTATRLMIFWCRATGPSMASPVVADSGARQTAFIMTFAGCIESGDPIDATSGSVTASAAAVSIPGGTTISRNTLAVLALANGGSYTAPTVQQNFANTSLTDLVKRASTQPAGTGGIAPPTGTFLRIGPFTTVNPGYGPGNDQSGAQWGVIKRNPTASDILSMIGLADQKDVLLVLALAGSKSRYRDASGNLTLPLYEAALDRFTADSTINDALQDALDRRRAVVYVTDEPNLNDDASPTLTNQFAGACKTRWPGCITIVRLAPTIFQSGWGPWGPLASYDKIDYGWAQYNRATARAGTTPAGHWSTERTAGTAVNMGVAISINVWAGGLSSNVDGVTACWNTDGAGGNNGYIIGKLETNETAFVACGGLGAAPLPGVIASPAWLQHFLEAAAADTVMPFCMMWEDSVAPSSSENFAPFWLRADMVAAMNAGISAGAARASWVGWRSAKP